MLILCGASNSAKPTRSNKEMINFPSCSIETKLGKADNGDDVFNIRLFNEKETLVTFNLDLTESLSLANFIIQELEKNGYESVSN